QVLPVPTEDRRWPLLLLAPTMWLPMDVSETLHPYLATRAALRYWRGLEAAGGGRVWHMLMPGLGTGRGRVAPRACALQTRRAYDEVVLGRLPRHGSVEAAMEDFRQLVDGGDPET